MAEKNTSRVNTGTRTKAQDAEALKALKTSAESESGKTVVEENGATFIVEKNSFGMTIKTRIA